jgi:hypothetical protein
MCGMATHIHLQIPLPSVHAALAAAALHLPLKGQRAHPRLVSICLDADKTAAWPSCHRCGC